MGTKKGQMRKTARRAYEPKKKGQAREIDIEKIRQNFLRGSYAKRLGVTRRKRGRDTNLFEFFFGEQK